VEQTKGRFVVESDNEIAPGLVVTVAREIVHVGGDFQRQNTLEERKYL
jgi:hypothetical protein